MLTRRVRWRLSEASAIDWLGTPEKRKLHASGTIANAVERPSLRGPLDSYQALIAPVPYVKVARWSGVPTLGQNGLSEVRWKCGSQGSYQRASSFLLVGEGVALQEDGSPRRTTASAAAPRTSRSYRIAE